MDDERAAGPEGPTVELAPGVTLGLGLRFKVEILKRQPDGSLVKVGEDTAVVDRVWEEGDGHERGAE